MIKVLASNPAIGHKPLSPGPDVRASSMASRFGRGAVIALLLLLAGGCALLTNRPGLTEAETQAHLENLLTDRNYQQALDYLPELAPYMDEYSFEDQRKRLLKLIDDLETETEERAAELLENRQLGLARQTVEQALDKIPQSARLKELGNSLRQEYEKRKKSVERQLLINRTAYLSVQLRGQQQLDLLEETSWYKRWRLKSMNDSLKTLRPELVECGRQALAAGEDDVAAGCLQLAGDIESSTEIEQMLDRIKTKQETPEEPTNTEAVPDSAPEPISEVKKTRPVVPAEPSPAELENRLQAEIIGGEIKKGYATLAILKEFPESAEMSRHYQAQLDLARDDLVDKYLQDGAEYYRGGMISKAREVWQQVLELDPDNQAAREKIARAERVLKKLQDLQDSQQKMVPPQ